MTKPADAPLHLLIIHRPDATEGYASYLRSEGFVISEATGSDDGVAKARALKPDLIVLDFDLDGETTDQLQAHRGTMDIPVIALAALDKIRAKRSPS